MEIGARAFGQTHSLETVYFNPNLTPWSGTATPRLAVAADALPACLGYGVMESGQLVGTRTFVSPAAFKAYFGRPAIDPDLVPVDFQLSAYPSVLLDSASRGIHQCYPCAGTPAIALGLDNDSDADNSNASIASIGEAVFADCTDLRHFRGGPVLAHIGNNSFIRATNLAAVFWARS